MKSPNLQSKLLCLEGQVGWGIVNSVYEDTKTTQKYMLNLCYMSYAIQHYALRGSPTTNFQLN